jgi:hypothetical protein
MLISVQDHPAAVSTGIPHDPRSVFFLDTRGNPIYLKSSRVKQYLAVEYVDGQFLRVDAVARDPP